MDFKDLRQAIDILEHEIGEEARHPRGFPMSRLKHRAARKLDESGISAYDAWQLVSQAEAYILAKYAGAMIGVGV